MQRKFVKNRLITNRYDQYIFIYIYIYDVFWYIFIIIHLFMLSIYNDIIWFFLTLLSLEEREAVQPAPVLLDGLPEVLAVHGADVDPHGLVKVLGEGEAEGAGHVPARGAVSLGRIQRKRANREKGKL